MTPVAMHIPDGYLGPQTYVVLWLVMLPIWIVAARKVKRTLKTKQILTNAFGVLGIEMIAAAQALDFREFTPGAGTRAAKAAVRAVVEHLEVDRPLFADHNAMMAAVERCDVLAAVEDAIGPLVSSW